VKFLVGLIMMLLAAPAAAVDPVRGKVVDKVEAIQLGGTYAAYVPSGYTADREWPIAYILDPRARGALAAERFRAAAEKHGYILASSNSSQSDVQVDPNPQALKAMWADTHGRFRIDQRRVYLVGFSGTARSAIYMARQLKPGTIAGIVAVGAGYPGDRPRKGDPFLFYGAVGNTDFNFDEVMQLEPALAAAAVTHHVEVFDGAHQWPPEAPAIAVFDWLELQAMKAGSRPRDEALVEAVWKDVSGRATAAQASGDLIQAHRIWTAAAADFEGLRDVAPAAGKAAALAADPEFKRQTRERQSRARQVEGYLARAAILLAEPDAPGVIEALHIPELQKTVQSGASADERQSAKRVLNKLAVQTGFYVPQRLAERKEWDRMAASLTIAIAINPDNADLYFQRATAHARKGDRKRAIADLGLAVQKGYKDAAALGAEAAFNAIRQEPGYQDILKSIGSRPAT